ncbi:MAG: L,D-transpeptidase [Longimicrobiales bacterium]
MSDAAPAWRPTFGPSPSAAPVSHTKVVLAAVAVVLLVALVAGAATAAALSFTLAPVPVAAPALVADSVEAATQAAAEAPDDPALEPLREEVGKLEASLAAKVPRRAYIVIDRYNNRLWLRRGSEIRLEAVVSAGSGTILKESGGQERVWTFDTPPGRFQVLSERRNPVWTKPDWAFLEEGQEPPDNFAERREKGSLGEWALDLGDGYMIHGTLYERLLGRNITHGCVRVGRDDLRVVAEAAAPGTPVFIF